MQYNTIHLITRPRMGPSLGFVTYVFYFLCWAVLHIMVCSIAPFDLYCAIGDFKIAPLELYCANVSGYYLSFKWSGKVVFLLGPELPTGDGWERASHWSSIAPLGIIFFDTIWVSSDQERLWRIWRWFVIWCGESVWQWRKFKREMWRSCFRKTLCGLKRNKGYWLNARRTKRMRLVGEVGWSIGECRFNFTMPVAGCRRIEFIPSARSY